MKFNFLNRIILRRKASVVSVVMLIAMFACVLSCQTIEVGYISDYMAYSPKKLEVRQGVVGFSKSLTLDGTTPPIEVELLEIRDKKTGKSTDVFFKEHEVSIFTGVVTSSDVTLEQLNKKIQTYATPSIMVNRVGGRVGLTRATLNIDTGRYTIDVQVSNSLGVKKVLKDALEIRVLPTNSNQITYQALSTSDVGSETNFVASSNYQVSIQHILSGENKIIFKWVDKNGVPFNPKAGEVIKRGDRPTFADWVPYYEPELTDTAIVYKYPSYPGVSLPYYNQTTVQGASWTNGITYYRVIGTATDIRRNLNPVTTYIFYLPGTHIVTFKFNDVNRVN